MRPFSSHVFVQSEHNIFGKVPVGQIVPKLGQNKIGDHFVLFVTAYYHSQLTAFTDAMKQPPFIIVSFLCPSLIHIATPSFISLTSICTNTEPIQLESA